MISTAQRSHMNTERQRSFHRFYLKITELDVTIEPRDGYMSLAEDEQFSLYRRRRKKRRIPETLTPPEYSNKMKATYFERRTLFVDERNSEQDSDSPKTTTPSLSLAEPTRRFAMYVHAMTGWQRRSCEWTAAIREGAASADDHNNARL